MRAPSVSPRSKEVREELAKHFTVLSYDRPGRGDSGDIAPCAVKREIDDLGALIAAIVKDS